MKLKKFLQLKSLILVLDVTIDRIAVFNKANISKKGFKYIIGCQYYFEKFCPCV